MFRKLYVFLISIFFQDCLQTCIQQIEDTFKTASENVNNKIKTQKHIPANSSPSKVNNNTKQSKLEPTKDLDNVTDRKSQTPTEVFSADWLFVA